jgi:hypothetical protein
MVHRVNQILKLKKIENISIKIRFCTKSYETIQIKIRKKINMLVKSQAIKSESTFYFYYLHKNYFSESIISPGQLNFCWKHKHLGSVAQW